MERVLSLSTLILIARVLDFRSGGRGHRVVAQLSPGDEQIRVRDLQQGVPERPESAAAPPWTQPSMEAEAESGFGSGSETSLCVP